jgi:NADPH2:quinone reductase
VLKRAGDLFGWIEGGKLKVTIGASFSLGDAAAAHRKLETRQSAGKLLLIP